MERVIAHGRGKPKYDELLRRAAAAIRRGEVVGEAEKHFAAGALELAARMHLRALERDDGSVATQIARRALDVQRASGGHLNAAIWHAIKEVAPGSAGNARDFVRVERALYRLTKNRRLVSK
jgi:hypothetical protein